MVNDDHVTAGNRRGPAAVMSAGDSAVCRAAIQREQLMERSLSLMVNCLIISVATLSFGGGLCDCWRQGWIQQKISEPVNKATTANNK